MKKNLKRIISYVLFFSLTLAFMVLFGHDETIQATESTAIQQFQATAKENQANQSLAAGNIPSPSVKETAPTASAKTVTSPEATLPTTQAKATVAPSSTTAKEADAPSVEKVIGTGEIIEDGVNIRVGPGLEHIALGMLYRYDKVEVLSQEGAWVQIRWNNATGYVSKDFIKVTLN